MADCRPSWPAADEVRATLAAGGCPLPLVARAEQAYRAASRQVRALAHCARRAGNACEAAAVLAAAASHAIAHPAQAGFDGPLIVELSMLRTLVSIYKARSGLRGLLV